LQLMFDPGISLEQYASGVAPRYSAVKQCPMCRAHVTLIGHGCYHRFALTELGLTYSLCIKRLFCPVCRQTACQWPLEIPHFWPSEFPTPLDLA